MKTFWDLDEREQAGLTDDEVRRFVDIELMGKGVEVPTPPPMTPELKINAPLRTVTMFSVGPMLFDTTERANAFKALCPKIEKYDYRIGYKWKYPADVDDEVKPEVLYLAEDVIANGRALAEHDAKAGEIDKARGEYEKAAKAAAVAAEPIWKARTAAVAAASRYQHIVATYDRYLSLAGNEETTAFRFLENTFGESQVTAAFAWAKRDEPSFNFPTPVESPAKAMA